MREIKEGQEVYINESVRYGFSNYKNFTIKLTIERTTKTQFIVNGRRFRKDNMSEIGQYCSYARFEGVDQSIAMNEFKKVVSISNKVYSLTTNFPSMQVNTDIKTAEKVFKMLTEAKDLLSK